MKLAALILGIILLSLFLIGKSRAQMFDFDDDDYCTGYQWVSISDVQCEIYRSQLFDKPYTISMPAWNAAQQNDA